MSAASKRALEQRMLDLIGQTYDAAIDPARWVGVADDMARMLGMTRVGRLPLGVAVAPFPPAGQEARNGAGGFATIFGLGTMLAGAHSGNMQTMQMGADLAERGIVSSVTGEPLDLNGVGGPSSAAPAATPATRAAASTAVGGGGVTQICSTDRTYAQMRDLCRNGVNSQAACYRAAAILCECYLAKDERSITPIVGQEHQQWQHCAAANRASAQSER